MQQSKNNIKPNADDLIGQRSRRIQKVDQLRKLGIDPYPSRAQKDHSNQNIIDHFSEYEAR